jgi:hypothetical protein
MKRFFDERLIAVSVAAAFALGTFNPEFALLRGNDSKSSWYGAWLLPDEAPQAAAAIRRQASPVLAANEAPAR